MIPFKDLQTLCDKLRDKTGSSCTVSVEYWSYSHTREPSVQRMYGLYIAGIGHSKYKTVRELKFATNNILNPQEDAGVSLAEEPCQKKPK